MTALYNEIEPFAADWLANLIKAGHIAPGTVDRRSIADVRPDDVMGAPQAHFFAGIGAWSYALRLAGWPDERPVWTGSCPCQPFSVAGDGKGVSDSRHLWPQLFRLIRECRPPVCFGEQVSGPDGEGWLDLVYADLEGIGYAVGAAVLPAAGVGAPHGRHRIFWVGYANGPRSQGRGLLAGNQRGEWAPGSASADGGLEDTTSEGRRGRNPLGEGRVEQPGGSGAGAVELAYPADKRRREGGLLAPWHSAQDRGRTPDQHSNGSASGPWGDVEYLPCIDGKARPTQPGLHPLAYGVAGRVGLLRAYGNAIVPQVAATFIRAFMDVLP